MRGCPVFYAPLFYFVNMGCNPLSQKAQMALCKKNPDSFFSTP